MSITRPRRQRILENAGLRHVSAWLPAKTVKKLQPKINATKILVAEEMARVAEEDKKSERQK